MPRCICAVRGSCLVQRPTVIHWFFITGCTTSGTWGPVGCQWVNYISFTQPQLYPPYAWLRSIDCALVWISCAIPFQVTLLRESVPVWKDRLVTILMRVTVCTCSSASTASYKPLINTTCSVVKFTGKPAWSNFRRISACLSVTAWLVSFSALYSWQGYRRDWL